MKLSEETDRVKSNSLVEAVFTYLDILLLLVREILLLLFYYYLIIAILLFGYFTIAGFCIFFL